MSLNSQGAASLIAKVVLPTLSAANTAAATTPSGDWLDTQALDGDIVIAIVTGVIAGSVTVKVQSATDATGANAADVPGAVSGVISTPGQSATIIVQKAVLANRYLGVVGTIVTGPVLIGAIALGSPKYIG